MLPEDFIGPTIEDATRKTALGILSVKGKEGASPLPLADVRISARVNDRIAQVSIEQVFQNPHSEFLEAIYTFPISGGAAVHRFEMRVADRIVKGIVKEREEAKKVYEQAIQDGKQAAILEKERDDVFTVQLGNLPPGEKATIRIEYSERLSFFEDGTTELRLPIVVAPRYMSGLPLEGFSQGAGVQEDTTRVPDASRISPPRLAEGFDPKVALSIEVAVEGGAFEELVSSQHAIRLSKTKIALSLENELLNRDFILRWRLVGDQVRTTALVTKEGAGILSILAPKPKTLIGCPRDIVIIQDCSGSMGGEKMVSAVRSCSLLLETLGPKDRFAICAFGSSTVWFKPHRFESHDFMSATPEAIEDGLLFLRRAPHLGGTELATPMREALDLISRGGGRGGRAPVIVVLTDGQVGAEADILKMVQTTQTGATFFTVGIDRAVNQPFLERLAKLGNGTCTCVVPGENLEAALSRIAQEIGVPLVSSIWIEGIDRMAGSMSPVLFGGRSLSVYFRKAGPGPITIRGTYADGSLFSQTVPIVETDLEAVNNLWAREKVAQLEDVLRALPYVSVQGTTGVTTGVRGQPDARELLKKEIIALAIRHTLLTPYTSFIAVDEKVVNENGETRTIVQPVEMPEGWQIRGLTGLGGAFGAQGATGVQGATGIQGTTGTQGIGPNLVAYASPSDGKDRPKVTAEDLDSLGKVLLRLEKALATIRMALERGSPVDLKRLQVERRAVQRILAKPIFGSEQFSDLKRAIDKILQELLNRLKMGEGWTPAVQDLFKKVEDGIQATWFMTCV